MVNVPTKDLISGISTAEEEISACTLVDNQMAADILIHNDGFVNMSQHSFILLCLSCVMSFYCFLHTRLYLIS